MNRKELHKTIEQSIASYKFSEAIGLLIELSSTSPSIGHPDDIQKIAEDYKRMIAFLPTEADINKRHEIQDSILRQLHTWFANFEREQLLMEDTQSIYCLTFAQAPQTEIWDKESLIIQIETGERHIGDSLFNLIATLPQLTDQHQTDICDIIEMTDSANKMICISALMVANLFFFDPKKLEILLHYCHSEDAEIRCRALLGTTLTIYGTALPLSAFPTLEDKVNEIFASQQIKDELIFIQHFLSSAARANELSNVLMNDIIPTLMKNSTVETIPFGFESEEDEDDANAFLHNKTTDRSATTGDASPAETDESATPNFKVEVRKVYIPVHLRRKVFESVEQIEILRRDGFTNVLTSMKELYSHPFFNSLAHWFAPYEPSREEYCESIFSKDVTKCDIDKFILGLAMQQLPEQEVKVLTKMLQEVFSQHPNAGQNEEEMPAEDSIENIYKRTIVGLSRVIDKIDKDILFSDNGISLIHHNVFGKVVAENKDFLCEIGILLFRFCKYDAAAHLLELYVHDEGASIEHLTMLALCYAEMGNHYKSINYLQQAELLDDGERKESLLRMKQQCYKQLGKTNERIECLFEIENIKPDDYRLVRDTGLALIDAERWDEAAQHFHKLEYLGKFLLPSLRAIAWCALNQGKFEKAQTHYERIFNEYASSTNWEDLINYGHTLLLTGNYASALETYIRGVKQYAHAFPESKDITAPLTMDAKLLKKYGIDHRDMALLIDAIRQSL